MLYRSAFLAAAALMANPVASGLSTSALNAPVVNAVAYAGDIDCFTHQKRGNTIYMVNDCKFDVWIAICVTPEGSSEEMQFDPPGLSPETEDTFTPGGIYSYRYRMLESDTTTRGLDCY